MPRHGAGIFFVSCKIRARLAHSAALSSGDRLVNYGFFWTTLGGIAKAEGSTAIFYPAYILFPLHCSAA